MIGCHNGLFARLKKDNPFMTNIHCVAHRASLCLVDGVKSSNIAQELGCMYECYCSFNVKKFSVDLKARELTKRIWMCGATYEQDPQGKVAK